MHKNHLNPTNVKERHKQSWYSLLLADHLVLHAFAPVIQKLGSCFNGGPSRFPLKRALPAITDGI